MGFESGFFNIKENKEKKEEKNVVGQETRSESADQKELQQAEYFVDRIINSKTSDQNALQIETRYLEMHVGNLLDMMTKPPLSEISDIRNEAERIILKLFQNAEYADETQLNSPTSYRKYKDQYRESMKKIYSFLALQTLASSGNVTKDYNHLTYFSTNGDMGPSVISALERRDKGEVTRSQTQASNELMKKILESYGIPPEDTIKAWKLSGYSQQESDEIALGAMQNIESMRYLEKANPGSVHTLYKQFGIRHFGRYPEKLLEEQYKERDNCDKPYGVMFSAIDDHNGALRTDWGDTKDIWQHLEEKYLFRIFEFDRKFSLGRRFVECDNKYGKNHKISFAKFNGHGKRNSIVFGKRNEGVWNFLARTLFKKSDSTSITSHDLEGSGFKRAKDFFIKSPHLIFQACSAGEEGGFVQKASKIYETEALGQDYTGSSLPIRPVLDDRGVITKFEAYAGWEELAGRYHKGERIGQLRSSKAA